jgi:predicted amidohydrolase
MRPPAGFRSGFLFLTVLVTAAACAPVVPEDDTVCGLSFEDRGDVRVFVVGHAFSLEDAASPEHFEVSFREDMRRIAPCLSSARPNLVLFPEDAGLVAWFAGRRAMLARGSGDSETAFNAMYAGYYRQVDEYRRRFPGISAARALTLALGDVAWRAMDTTFGGIARRYGVYVITSANLPYVETRSDDASVALFRDPDAPDDAPAYVATRGECFNSALLYGPTGELLQRIDKVYLTETEEDSLDLTYAPLEGLGVFELPFGRVGAAISRDAFYAPFLQRMEDLGAELVVQPEAWSGWMVEDSQGGWLPDVILASGWTHTQKYRGFRHNATPMLVGNLFDLTFDGQTWITRKSTPAETPRAFVGSRPLGGWVDVGPWTYPDPVEQEPGLSLEERRARLLARGNALAAGSGHDTEGRYVGNVIAADLELSGEGSGPVVEVTPTGQGLASREVAPSPSGHQTNPDAAYDAAGRLYVVFTDSREGMPRVYLTTSDDDGRTFSPARPVAPGVNRQLRPTVAAGAAGRVMVAWQESRDGGPEQLHAVVSTDGAETLSEPFTVEATGASQWEADLAYQPGSANVALVWTDFREGLAPKVRLARSADGGRTWGPSVRVDPGNAHTDKVEGSQLQPTVTWSAQWLAVAWIDYRERDWEVYAVVAPASSGALPEAIQVSPPSPVETLASDPQLAPGPGSSVVLVWDDQRERRGHHDVRGARFSDGAWGALPLLTGGADAGAFISRFRPSVAAVREELRAVFQDLTSGKNGLGQVRLPQGHSPEQPATPERLDDSGSAANQLTRPRAVSRQDFSAGVVVFEDEQSGYSRLRTSQLL